MGKPENTVIYLGVFKPGLQKQKVIADSSLPEIDEDTSCSLQFYIPVSTFSTFNYSGVNFQKNLSLFVHYFFSWI